jgi:hypothetical protein
MGTAVSNTRISDGLDSAWQRAAQSVWDASTLGARGAPRARCWPKRRGRHRHRLGRGTARRLGSEDRRGLPGPHRPLGERMKGARLTGQRRRRTTQPALDGRVPGPERQPSASGSSVAPSPGVSVAVGWAEADAEGVACGGAEEGVEGDAEDDSDDEAEDAADGPEVR